MAQIVTQTSASFLTMVGNAARMIVKEEPTSPTEHQAQSEHLFNAYGLKPNAKDPVASSIAALLAHIQDQDKQICELMDAVKRLDPNFKPKSIKSLCKDDLSVLNEDTVSDFVI